jgi:hypothetical protein
VPEAYEIGSGFPLVARTLSGAGGVVCRVQDGRRQWLRRDEALFAECEWAWSFEVGNAFVFAGYGCAEAVAEILTKNGEGQCYPVVCKGGAALP